MIRTFDHGPARSTVMKKTVGFPANLQSPGARNTNEPDGRGSCRRARCQQAARHAVCAVAPDEIFGFTRAPPAFEIDDVGGNAVSGRRERFSRVR
jgi:hypothetical protein